MRRIRSDRRGLTLVELIIGAALVCVLLVCAGGVYVAAERSFRTGSRKLLAQREASFLSTVISRQARVADHFDIYTAPNRNVLADSGNSVAFRGDAPGNALLGRIEWHNGQQTLVDSSGVRVTSMRLRGVGFSRHAVDPTVLHYRFQTDDEVGNLVDVVSAVAARN